VRTGYRPLAVSAQQRLPSGRCAAGFVATGLMATAGLAGLCVRWGRATTVVSLARREALFERNYGNEAKDHDQVLLPQAPSLKPAPAPPSSAVGSASASSSAHAKAVGPALRPPPPPTGAELATHSLKGHSGAALDRSASKAPPKADAAVPGPDGSSLPSGQLVADGSLQADGSVSSGSAPTAAEGDVEASSRYGAVAPSSSGSVATPASGASSTLSSRSSMPPLRHPSSSGGVTSAPPFQESNGARGLSTSVSPQLQLQLQPQQLGGINGISDGDLVGSTAGANTGPQSAMQHHRGSGGTEWSGKLDTRPLQPAGALLPMPRDGPATQVVLGTPLPQSPSLHSGMRTMSPLLASREGNSGATRSTTVLAPSFTEAVGGSTTFLYTTTTVSFTALTLHTAASASSTSTTPLVNTTIPLSSVKLYCWALMMPHGDEVTLVRMMLNKNAGLFRCDQYSVFSDGDITLSPGPPVRIGTTDIGSVKCNYGGPWYLALNSEVFLKVWRKVFKEELYLQNEWTVKIDPDAVFLPDRLRQQVLHFDSDADVYLNDCDQGLHGPIEVIARGGMKVFDRGCDKCEKHLKHEFDQWGEDVFLRHCLGFLKVNRVDDFRLLSEDRCFYENPAQNGCTSGKVAFHPFKKPDTYFRCLKEAERDRDEEEDDNDKEGKKHLLL